MAADNDTIDTSVDTSAPAGEAAQGVDAPSAGLHDLSKADRDSFYATGKLPAAKDPDADADSSTAPSGEQSDATASKTAPASETGKPAPGKKARNSEEGRISELLEDRRRDREMHSRLQRDNDDLKKRLEALEKPKSDAKPDSSTAVDPSEPAWKKYRAMKDAPKADDFEHLDDYVAAMGTFVAQQIARQEATGVITERETKQAERAAADRDIETAVDTAHTRLQADETAFPDLKAKVDDRFKQIVPARLMPDGQAIGPHHYAKDQITFESEHPLQLSAFYSTEDGLAEWAAMMKMPPKQIERTILARDLAFRRTPAQGKPAAAAKTFTKTPEPPENTGKKPSHVGDPAEAAVKKGDFRAFMSAMDEREGARR
jgi:hypothetical protein